MPVVPDPTSASGFRVVPAVMPTAQPDPRDAEIARLLNLLRGRDAEIAMLTEALNDIASRANTVLSNTT